MIKPKSEKEEVKKWCPVMDKFCKKEVCAWWDELGKVCAVWTLSRWV